MNMAVNFKFSCACAGNLQRLMSAISVASEFGSVLRQVVKEFIIKFFHIRRVLLMNVMFLVAAKIHFGWHACDQFLGAGTMMLIFYFISIYNVHLLLHIPRIETGAFSLLY